MAWYKRLVAFKHWRCRRYILFWKTLSILKQLVLSRETQMNGFDSELDRNDYKMEHKNRRNLNITLSSKKCLNFHVIWYIFKHSIRMKAHW